MSETPDGVPTEPPQSAEPASRTPALTFIAIAAIAVLFTLVAASWVIWGRSSEIPGTAMASDTVTDAGSEKSSATLPAGAVECTPVIGPTGDLTNSARGNDVTSCPFAEETRIAYAQGGSAGGSRMVVVYSPVTKQRYDMSCVVSGPGPLVTCTGGNDAVVYLF